MGMTDSQFKSYVRFLLSVLEDLKNEQDEEKKQAKLDRLMDNLQKALED